MTDTYLAVDLEMIVDQQLYKMHKSFDRTSDDRAKAIKRVQAAAAFEFTLGSDGQIKTGPVASWTEHGWGDEREVVSQLFEYIRERDHQIILTYGGVGTDVPVLLFAAMKNGLTLPRQWLHQPWVKGKRSHLDLEILLRNGSGNRHHLSQVMLRLGVPLELVEQKASASFADTAEGWQELQDHCELDCLLLAVAKLAWMKAQGIDGIDYQAAVIALIAGFLRRRPEHRLAVELQAYADDLQLSMTAGFAMAA